MSERFIYFIQNDDTKHIKIGSAGDVEKRRQSLQTGSSGHLTILSMIPEIEEGMESRLHAQFQRDRLQGEWFNPSTDLLNYIQAQQKCGVCENYVQVFHIIGNNEFDFYLCAGCMTHLYGQALSDLKWVKEHLTNPEEVKKYMGWDKNA